MTQTAMAAAAALGADVFAEFVAADFAPQLDGGDLQDWAASAGLLRAEPVTTPCGLGGCACEPGDTCYRVTDLGADVLAWAERLRP